MQMGRAERNAGITRLLRLLLLLLLLLRRLLPRSQACRKKIIMK